MRTKDLTNKIEHGFSELAPDMFDTILLKIEQGQNEPMLVEETIEEKRVFGKLQKRLLPVSVGLVMVCMLFFLIFPWNTNEISVIMKVNPRIQIVMNDSYEVIKLKGLNQDGKDVVKELKWEKKESIDILMQTLLADLTEKSYLKQDGEIQLTVSAKQDGVYDKVETILEKEIEKNLTSLGYTEVSTVCHSKGTGKSTTTKDCEVPDETETTEQTTHKHMEVPQPASEEQKDITVPKEETQKNTEKQKDEHTVSHENKLPEETGEKPSLGTEESEKKPSVDEKSPEHETKKPAENKSETGNEGSEDNSSENAVDKNVENRNENPKHNNWENENSHNSNRENEEPHAHDENWDNKNENSHNNENNHDNGWRNERGSPFENIWENEAGSPQDDEEDENLYPLK